MFLDYDCSTKAEFKRGGEIVEEFCYHGDMFSSYGGASEVVSARIGSAQKKAIVLAGVLVGK